MIFLKQTRSKSRINIICESPVTSCIEHVQAKTTLETLSRLLQPKNAFGTKLISDINRLRHLDSNLASPSNAESTIFCLASRLDSVGHSLSIHFSAASSPHVHQGKSTGKSVFRNLRHEFLLVHGQGEYEGLEYVVDLAFRDQFEIPQPSSSYHELLGDVPQVFVGPVSSLIPVVQIVCSEMAVSFTIRGQTLPPWRKTEAILSKWLPQHVKDTPLAQMDNGGREVDRRQMARGTFEAKGSKQGSLRKTIQGFHVGGITPSSFKGSPL